MAVTKISKHISYKEGTHSNTATRRRMRNEPDEVQLKAMKLLSKEVFEPLRAHFDQPIRVNSFFRSAALNKAIGGSRTSQHCSGEAIDIDATNGVTNKQLFDYIKDNLDFDQLIWEFGTDKNPDWVHVSYTETRANRKQILKAVKFTYTGSGHATLRKVLDKWNIDYSHIPTGKNAAKERAKRSGKGKGKRQRELKEEEFEEKWN